MVKDGTCNTAPIHMDSSLKRCSSVQYFLKLCMYHRRKLSILIACKSSSMLKILLIRYLQVWHKYFPVPLMNVNSYVCIKFDFTETVMAVYYVPIKHVYYQIKRIKLHITALWFDFTKICEICEIRKRKIQMCQESTLQSPIDKTFCKYIIHSVFNSLLVCGCEKVCVTI